MNLAVGQFSRWAKTNILDNEFAVENEDYTGVDIDVEGNIVPDYKLRISFAKKLCMKQGNERGEQARDYFIKVEDKLKEVAEKTIDISKLSPELQMFKQIWDGVAKTQLEQSELQKQLSVTAEKVGSVETTLSIIQDTIVQRDDDWRDAINKMLNNAVVASGTGDYRALRQRTYEILEERARCRLNVKLSNLKDRLKESGATKSKINAASKLDVIEGDVRLKEIYTSIVKEFSIRYAAKEA